MRGKMWVTIAAVTGVAAIVGAVVLAGDGDREGTVTVSAGSEESASLEGAGNSFDPASTDTTIPPSTSTTAAAPTTATSVTPAPTSTTTRPVPTTTTTKPRPAATVTPIGWSEPNLAGQRYFRVRVSGAGCSGAENGWGFTVYDPAGQPFNGDGGQATADGNWQMEFSFYSAHAPGRYTFKASCSVAIGQVLFAYDPVSYDWAGGQ